MKDGDVPPTDSNLSSKVCRLTTSGITTLPISRSTLNGKVITNSPPLTNNTIPTSRPVAPPNNQMPSTSNNIVTTQAENSLSGAIRIRNREHARNTRLRKKAYIEELKLTLNEVSARYDAKVKEHKAEEERDLEVRNVRYQVMEEFLKLRASGSDTNFAKLLARWALILDDGFTLTLPKIEYRTVVENDALGQVLRGAAECLEDASKIASFVNALFSSNNPLSKNLVTTCYLYDRKNLVMDRDIAVLEWTGITLGAMAQGAISELKVKGHMKATFNSVSNKLINAELLFDTGSVISYISNFMHIHEVNQSTNKSSPNVSLASDMRPGTSEGNGICANVTIASHEGDYSSDEEYKTIPSRKKRILFR